HEWKPGQIANVAGERAQAPNARLGFIDAALEDGDAVPIRRQHGGGRTPQLLTATPAPVPADEDDVHCAILVSFSTISSASSVRTSGGSTSSFRFSRPSMPPRSSCTSP